MNEIFVYVGHKLTRDASLALGRIFPFHAINPSRRKAVMAYAWVAYLNMHQTQFENAQTLDRFVRSIADAGNIFGE